MCPVHLRSISIPIDHDVRHWQTQWFEFRFYLDSDLKPKAQSIDCNENYHSMQDFSKPTFFKHKGVNGFQKPYINLSPQNTVLNQQKNILFETETKASFNFSCQFYEPYSVSKLGKQDKINHVGLNTQDSGEFFLLMNLLRLECNILNKLGWIIQSSFCLRGR